METVEEGGQNVDLKSILKGVIAHVDVRSGEDNRTEIFRGTLQKLGATVTRGLNKSVTHLVFFNGPKKTYEKAKRMGIHLLSAKWVIECHRLLARVPEEQHPAVISSDYDCPFSKIKMMKSLRPLTCEEYRKRDVANKKRLETRRVRKEILMKYKDSPPTPYIPKDYSKYGLIGNNYDPSELKKCFDRLAEMVGSEEEYDMDASDAILPLPLRILKNNPTPDSPIINILTKNQRKAAEIFFSKCGKRLKYEPDISQGDISDSLSNEPDISQGDISDSLSNTEDAFNQSASEEKLIPNTPVAELAQSPKTTMPKTKTTIPKPKSCLSDTPRIKKKRKRSIITPTPSPKTPLKDLKKQLSNNSLDEFKPKKIRKRRKLINFDQLVEDTQRLSIEQPETPGSRLKGLNETKRMVLTSYELWEKETVIPVIQHLGCYRLENEIKRRTTHVICRFSRRTFNVLMGIVNGCWILKGEWIMESLETGKWVNEECFELFNEYPGSRIARLSRMEKGANYKCNLFTNAGSIFVSNGTNLPRLKLLQLLETAGAEITSKLSDADIVIAMKTKRCKAKCVTEQWVLDSITHHKIFPLENYLIRQIDAKLS